MACMARSASEGFSTFLGDLPTHITVGVPYLATILLDKLNMHMWVSCKVLNVPVNAALACYMKPGQSHRLGITCGGLSAPIFWSYQLL
jgi:hypothetical protein